MKSGIQPVKLRQRSDALPRRATGSSSGSSRKKVRQVDATCVVKGGDWAPPHDGALR